MVLKWLLENTLSTAVSDKRPGYNEAKKIAAGSDVEQRKALAEGADIAPEFLYYFATDIDPQVRQSVARNRAAPLQADQILARDSDAEVRSELARKVAQLLPYLSEKENEQITDITFETLEILANDQVPAVRAIVAEEVKSLDNVPPRVVQTIARDIEDIVCAPVLQYSPLLNHDDLVEIIRTGISSGALVAVALRKNLQPEVSSAVVGSDDISAVAALLGNETAIINVSTMDTIVDKAPSREAWHGPLVNRSNLSVEIIRRVAGFVGEALVETLISRNPLRTDVSETLREAVKARIAISPAEATGIPAEAVAPDDEAGRGKIFEEAKIIDALQAGNREFAVDVLAERSGLPREQVVQMLDATKPEMIVTLAWKAAMSAAGTERLQQGLNVTESDLIRSNKDGSYGLSLDDRLGILFQSGVEN